MAHTTSRIDAPIVMPNDIAAVIAISGTDLAAICASNAINMWAKWKPFSYPSVGIVPDATRASNNYGIVNIPTWSNTYITHMANFVFGISPSENAPDIGVQPIYWGYQHPTGGSSSPYRLHDFSNAAKTYGYYHEAEAPCGGSTYTEYTIDSNGNLTINFNRGAEDVRTIALGDLSYPSVLSYSVSNMYLGVMMLRKDDSEIFAATRSTTIGSDNFETSIAITGLDASYNGIYKIFPFLSSVSFSFTGDLGQTSGKFIALSTNAEEVGIGSTIVRMDIVENSFGAYRDTSQSTHILYVNMRLENNTYSGSATLDATVELTVFNSSNSALATVTRSVSVAYNNSTLLSTQIDLSNITTLRAAYSVRAIVTPSQGTDPSITSASVLVSDGPSPYV